MESVGEGGLYLAQARTDAWGTRTVATLQETKCVSFLKVMWLSDVVGVRTISPGAGLDWCMGHPDGGDATGDKAVCLHQNNPVSHEPAGRNGAVTSGRRRLLVHGAALRRGGHHGFRLD